MLPRLLNDLPQDVYLERRPAALGAVALLPSSGCLEGGVWAGFLTERVMFAGATMVHGSMCV